MKGRRRRPHPRARVSRIFEGTFFFGGLVGKGGKNPFSIMIHPGFLGVGFVDFSYFLIDRPPPILCAGYFWCREFSEARSGVTPPLTTRRTGCLFPWILQVTVVAGNSSSYHTLY